MILSLSKQANLFLTSVYIGILIVIVYDFFRALRRTYKFSNKKVYMQDCIYILIITIYTLYKYLYSSNGEIRVYYFIGIIFGILIYTLTISSKVILIFELFLKFFQKVIYTIINFIIVPFKVIKKLIRPYLKIYLGIVNRKTKKYKNYMLKPKRYFIIHKKSFKHMVKVLKEKV